MKETWRWYGPLDAITLPQIAQTGAAGIVTALHDIPYGDVWPREAIAARRREIEAAGFLWDVVESLPVHEAIKRGDTGTGPLLANYRQSMANLAAEGITRICYNFMPVLDWTRTDLAAPVARGGTCLRFSAARMAAFEVHMLGRDAARHEYSEDALCAGDAWFRQADDAARADLLSSIMAGLPGAFDRYDIPALQAALARYDGTGREALRANLLAFLQAVIPLAEDLGILFAIHPDDPPRDILGLPRIVSNADDIAWIMEAVPSRANGLTLCSGSLGANPVNDVPAIAARFADRIHFAHLRNIRSEPDGSFEEVAHLDGDVDMVALVRALLDCAPDIPFRPDHGHDLLDDAERGAHPGYPLVGRLRGLSELRGVVAALCHGPVAQKR